MVIGVDDSTGERTVEDGARDDFVDNHNDNACDDPIWAAMWLIFILELNYRRQCRFAYVSLDCLTHTAPQAAPHRV